MALSIHQQYLAVISICVNLWACTTTALPESTDEFLDSSMITAKVKASLVDDPLTAALDIKVTTFKGVVQLSGAVETAVIKDRAVQIAQMINGVKAIKNEIVVK